MNNQLPPIGHSASGRWATLSLLFLLGAALLYSRQLPVQTGASFWLSLAGYGLGLLVLMRCTISDNQSVVVITTTDSTGKTQTRLKPVGFSAPMLQYAVLLLAMLWPSIRQSLVSGTLDGLPFALMGLGYWGYKSKQPRVIAAGVLASLALQFALSPLHLEGNVSQVIFIGLAAFILLKITFGHWTWGATTYAVLLALPFSWQQYLSYTLIALLERITQYNRSMNWIMLCVALLLIGISPYLAAYAQIAPHHLLAACINTVPLWALLALHMKGSYEQPESQPTAATPASGRG